ncbi:Mis6 domain-containing protein [Histoplasma capsulatum var. duboisii H88]|uniref:Mis6 domain-containing protein n=1 Tax=Ajellomyces capsulatus (strain H88) TaxID=544711 RepID=F0UV65_AJEC8|nr:Mis6 domain-containing protein [Histoplasma capsulatum var. duboisii H88]QSS50993.1 Mis6 domain-containing protein [Histoplasma capsulatum var. duboisii H88]
MEDAIEQLENVASISPKQRHTSVADLAKSIASNAYESGIPTHLLERLITIISKSKHLDQSTITTIVKNLYPSERVRPRTVSMVISCFGPSRNKPSPATQALLLRWLILVYDDMDDQSYLSRLYGVLFNFLDMISLRRSLCHLLSLISRRKHIKPFRIQALMELMKNTGGEERELLGLMKVFKSYYPDIIIGDTYASTGRATNFFKHPDPEWVKQMRHVQERTAAAGMTNPGQNVPQTFQVVRRGEVKRSRIEVVIPVVQTSRVKSDFTSLEEIRSANDFVQKLDRIEMPNQVAAALADPLAQRYLVFVRNEGATRRLESWLDSFFEDEVARIQAREEGDDEGNDPEHLEYVLDVLIGFVRFTKSMPQAVDKFLRKYLLSWNGHDSRTAILSLLEYIPIQEYNTLRQNYFIPLEKAILTDQRETKILILQYYSSLIQHWGSVIRATPSLFPVPPLPQVIGRAELLALTILESPQGPKGNGTNPKISGTLAVLRFYTDLAELFHHASTNGNIRIVVPQPQLIYMLTFTPTLSHLSTICSVLAMFKQSFETSLKSPTLQSNGSLEQSYPTEVVSRFNGYVIDICNLLWRNRGLNSDDPNALGCIIPALTVNKLSQYMQALNERPSGGGEEHKYQISSVFSLSQNVAFCNVSSACFRGIEESIVDTLGKSLSVTLTRPVTQKALAALHKDGGIRINWQEYRLRMLEWLDGIGAEGVGNLMRSTMKALR